MKTVSFLFIMALHQSSRKLSISRLDLQPCSRFVMDISIRLHSKDG